MQDFFFVGIISAIALGVFLIKGILFIIHLANLKTSNQIIRRNEAHKRFVTNQNLKTQSVMSSIENVANWRVDDPRIVAEDLRYQFLAKTKTRRTTPTSDLRASPRERIPLATTDFEEPFDEIDDENPVPIYTYNPSIRGTQV